MAKTRKIPPKQNLQNIPILIEDTNFYSIYFEINDLNRVFHAGKNGFLIRGSGFLKQNSDIAIEILDRYGQPVFATPVPGYSEGGARLISVEIFQTTPRGVGTLTILGVANETHDGRPIPSGWQNRYNVRWTVPIQIEPNNQNISKIRLANNPTVEVSEKNFINVITETQTITISDYSASLVYDFEGQKSDGYAIIMQDSTGSPIDFFSSSYYNSYFTGSIYKIVLEKTYDTEVEVPTSRSIVSNTVSSSVYMPIDRLVNNTIAITNTGIKFTDESEFINGILHNGTFEIVKDSVDFGNGVVEKVVEEYTASIDYRYTENSASLTSASSSIIYFRIPNISTITGNISKVKISTKEVNESIRSYQPFTEFVPSARNILIQTSSIGYFDCGVFDYAHNSEDFWFSNLLNDADGNFDSINYENSQSITPGLSRNIIKNSDRLIDGIYTDITSSGIPYFFGTSIPIQLYKDVEYTLKYNSLFSPTRISASTVYSTTDIGDMDVYLTRIGNSALARNSSSVVVTDSAPYGLLIDTITTKVSDKSLFEREINFTVPRTGFAHLRFVANSGFWDLSSIKVEPAVEKGFSPDEIIFDAENNFIVNSTNVFKIEFLDFEDSPVDYNLISSPVNITGSLSIKSVRLVSDRLAFVFDSNGLPTPADQTASVQLYAQNVSTAASWTVTNDLDAPISSDHYNIDGNNFQLYVSSFGNPVITGSALLVASADGLEDKVRIVKLQDGGVGTNAVQYIAIPLNGTVIKNKSGSLAVQLRKLDGSVITDVSSGTIKLRKLKTGSLADLSTVPGVSAGANGIDYNPIISSSAVSGSFDIAVVDTVAGNTILDTLTLIDVTDALPVGSVTPSSGLILLRERPSNTFSPAVTYLTASFYDRTGSKHSEIVEVSASYTTEDRLKWAYITNNANITTTVVDSNGSSVAATVWDNTKAMRFLFTFTEPRIGDTIVATETVVIASDGLDGADGSDGANGKIVTLTSDKFQIAYNSASSSPSPSSIMLSASAWNFTSPVYRFENDTDSTVIRDWSPIPSASYTSPSNRFFSKTIAVKASETASTIPELVIEAVDSIGIFGTKDGTDGLTVILTNEAHSFAASSAGVVSDYSLGGTLIYVYQGNAQLKVDNTSTYDTGSFRIGTLTSSSITGGAITQSDGSLSASIGPPSNMTQDQASIYIPVIITTLDYQTVTVTQLQTFSKSKQGAAGANGINSIFYYIEPLDGRSFKTSGGSTTPSSLRFVTKQISGSVLNSINSGSSFGLYISGSNLPVSGSSGNSIYTIYPTDITNHAVLLYKSGSGLPSSTNVVDTIDVTDLTDGVDGETIIYPLLSIDGVVAYKSSSTGITPTITTKITGSLIATGSVVEYVYLHVLPSNGALSSSFIGKSSTNISSSFTSSTTPQFDLTVNIFSGSSSPVKVLTETFVLIPDGEDGVSAGSVISTNGITFVRDQSYTYTPSNTIITASFYDVLGNSYNEIITATASYSTPYDQLTWNTKTSVPEITVAATDGGGNSVNSGVTDNTKVLNVVFTFTEPYTAQVSRVPITLNIVSDGIDGSDGSDGSDAKTARLISNNYVITYDGGGVKNPSAQSIGLTGSAINHSGSVIYYEFLRNSVSKQNTTSNLYTVPGADEPSAGSSINYTLKTRESSSNSTVIATDTISVFGIKEGTSGSNGEDAITIVLTNEAHTFAADSYGNVGSYVSGGTKIYVWEGTQSVPPDNFAPYASPSFRITTTGSSITPDASPVYGASSVDFGSPSNMTADTASVKYDVFVRNRKGTDLTFTKIQSYSKSKKARDIRYLLLQVGGATTFISSSTGITPTTITPVTASIMETGSIVESYRLNVFINSLELTSSIIQTSANISSSFTSSISSPKRLDMHFSFFSSSTLVGNQSFIITTNGAPGATGTSARVVSLNLDDYSIVYSPSGTSPSPVVITGSATSQGVTTPTYRWFRTGSLHGTGATQYFYSPSTVFDYQLIEVHVSQSTTGYAKDSTTIYGVKSGIAGENAFTVILTNEAHVFPAANDGTVSSYVGGGTSIEALYGGTNLTPTTSTPTSGQFSSSVVSQVNITADTISSINGSYLVYDEPSTMTQNSASITYLIRVVTGSIDKTFTKIQSFGKSIKGDTGPGGSDGTDGKTVSLNLNDYSVVYNPSGTGPSPTVITGSVTSQGVTIPTYRWFRTGSLHGTGATQYFYTPSDIFDYQLIEVHVSESTTGYAKDSATIYGVRDGLGGESGFTVILSNESHTFTAANDGTVSTFIGGGTDIEVLYGGTNLTPTTTAPSSGQFSSSVSQSYNVTPDTTSTVIGSTYLRYDPPSAMSQTNHSGSIVYRITAVTGSITHSFTKIQSFTKSIKGDTGTSGTNGSDGTDGKVVSLNLDDYSILYDPSGTTPTPTVITGSVTSQGVTTPTYRWFRTGSLHGTGDTQYFNSPSNIFDYQLIEVHVSESTVGYARDSATIYGVQNGIAGTDGFTVILTNESHTFVANENGVVSTFVGGGTEIEALYGGTNLTPTTSTPTSGQFSSSVSQSFNVTPVPLYTTVSPYIKYSPPTAMSQTDSTGSIVYKITAVTGSITKTFVKQQSFGKSIKGIDSSYGILSIDGVKVYNSSSTGWNTTTKTGVTASFYYGGTITATERVNVNLNSTNKTLSTSSISDSALISSTWSGNNTATLTISFTSASRTLTETFSVVLQGITGSVGIPGIPATSVSFPYNDLNTTSQANWAGAYCILTGSYLPAATNTGVLSHSQFITASGLALSAYDSSSTNIDVDHSSYYNQITTGDSVVFWISSRRWYAYQIISTGSVSGSGTSTSYLWNIRPISYDVYDGTGNLSTGVNDQNVEFKFSKASIGPGVVYRGDYNASTTYYDTVHRKDVVSYGGTYYITNNVSKNDTSTWGTPPTDWSSIGTSFSSVATDILLAQDVYANRTINIGQSGGTPLIALNSDYAGGGANPAIYISASSYNSNGIFLGFSTGTPKMSIRSGSQGMAWDGTSFSISGSISASAGTIGGISITSTQLQVGSSMWIKSNGHISGSLVYFTGGKIGGWTLASTTLTGGSIVMDSSGILRTATDFTTGNGWYLGTSNFRVGTAGGSRFLFDGTNIELYNSSNTKVASFGAINTIGGITASNSQLSVGSTLVLKSTGELTASNAQITGKITAQTGTIGGFTILSDRLHTGTTPNIVGIYPTVYPFFAGATDNSGTNAKFAVDIAGNVTASSFRGSGTTNQYTGSAYFTDLTTEGLNVISGTGNLNVRFSPVDTYEATLVVGYPSTGQNGHIYCYDISGSFRGDGSQLDGLPGTGKWYRKVDGGSTAMVDDEDVVDFKSELDGGDNPIVLTASGTSPNWAVEFNLENKFGGSATSGSGTQIPVIWIDKKGLVTGMSYAPPTASKVANAATFNNGGAGVASGTTFDGSVARTISYNTIGASPLAGSTSFTTAGTITTGTWSATAIAVNKGGTGLTSTPTNGQLLIGNGTNYTLATLTGTTNRITITNGAGSIQINTPQDLHTTTDFQVARITASVAMFSSGDIKSNADIIAYASSDITLKENIIPIDSPLEKVNSINGVYFDWKQSYIDKRGGEDGYFTRKHDIGVIAQEVEKILPEIVASRPDKTKGVRYEKIVPLLIEAIKELSRELDKLKKGNF